VRLRLRRSGWTSYASCAIIRTRPNMQTTKTSIEEAVKAFARGEFLVVTDDEARENEGDLIIAAQHATPEALAFMVRHTSGVICVPMLGERLDELRLPQMVTANADAHGTAFTVSCDVRHGTTTGISAQDRASTIRALADPSTTYADLARPGHVFPLRYCDGGVLRRAGHTEAAVDLARLAGLTPAAAICEIANEDGTIASGDALNRFATEHELRRISIADLIAYRRRHEKLVVRVAEARMPTVHGEFRAYVYESVLSGLQHLALVQGDLGGEPPLVRVHSECLTGDAIGSTRCDCGQQLELALSRISAEGRGALVYLRGHEGRGIGLGHKLRAYELQDDGLDTVEANLQLGFPADARRYGVGAQILVDLGVHNMRLMTNNPAKYTGLASFGLEIAERVPLISEPTPENVRYLNAKQEKLGHLLDITPHAEVAGE
ncbi:MAG TPA: bifunctional 3,4-dihydroxy-2-butanone-4-phosphate synthase/GTP cyclohydrolase II, partial [Candidatus Acidoferrum sp.]|nr:bifunctional 3,4-dihydroxy-2-butanone-4-phosphate synthase/GTP cyclohydrolase II [Candidatus Acidoferrum sp.]